MRAEAEPERAGEGGDLRRDDGFGPRAGGEQHGGVVDDADRADTCHEARRLEQEGAGLETGEARIVLDEQPARVRQHQAGTVQGDGLAGLSAKRPECHAVRRGVVLHLLPGREVVFAGASRRAAQIGVADPAGQGAVGHLQPLIGQQFAHPDDVAASAGEGGLEPDQRRVVAWRRLTPRITGRLTQDPPHRVARHRQQAADLA